MSDGSSKFTSIIALVLVLPLLLLFQNCGSADGYGASGDEELSAREAYNSASGGNGYTSASGAGGGSSGGATGGTFTLPGGSGGSGGGSSGSGGSGGNPFGPVKSDGTNCGAGVFAIERQVWNNVGGDDSAIGMMRKFLPLVERRNVTTVGTQMEFDAANHGDAVSVSCSESFDKLRRFFPSRFFDTRHYRCGENAGNVTTMQCRSGQWFFAGTSCSCERIPLESFGGSDR